MSSQRSGVAFGFVVVLVATAGCLGALTGAEPLSFAANETVVTEGALEETGYEQVANQSVDQTVTVTVQGQEREVRATSYFTFYNRSVDPSGLGANASEMPENVSTAPAPATQFAVLATPAARVGGVAANPLASLSTEDLLRRFFDRARDTEDVDRNVSRDANLTLVGNRTVESLGTERTVSTYRVGNDSASTADGESVLVDVARFEDDGDVIVAVAVHPSRLDEEARIDRLLDGLEQQTG